MKVNFLNVGKTKYGDCILIEEDGQTILIDGAHPGDDRQSENLPQSIPDQLEDLLGPAPHQISLLVVTHCHSDHIGCLPALVAAGTIRVTDALVADETLGFGRLADGGPNAAPDAASLGETVRKVVAALREEPRGAGETDEELAEFLTAADDLESNYGQMLAKLQQDGTNVIRYTGQSVAALERKYRSFKFKVFGPTNEHLTICARAIARFQRDAADMLNSLTTDADIPAVDLYRSSLLSGLSDAEDQPGKGAALNDQSIVFSVAEGDRRALLVGDMQFAKPEIRGLDRPMTALRAKITAAGPYVLIKTAHHTAYNGLDDTLLREYAGKPLFVHSGGWNDPGHPDGGALTSLRNAADQIAGFVRTDHNGAISCDLSQDPIEVALEKGGMNDFTPNTGARTRRRDVAPASTAPEAQPSSEAPETLIPSTPPPVTPPPPLPPSTAGRGGTDDVVEVITRVPHRATKVTVTIQVEPAPGNPGGEAIPALPVAAPQAPAGGDALPKLLFVTSQAGLTRKIGAAETQAVLASIRARGGTILDTLADQSTSAAAALDEVKKKLLTDNYVGVVLLGGYDVVPPVRLDTLDPALRAQLPRPTGDSDNFIVWSDAEYGDTDDDALPELPVSRVPDGGSADFIRKLLRSGPAAGRSSFGLRNRARPFADGIYRLLNTSAAMLCSEPAAPQTLNSADLQSSNVYLMLHGSDRDATRFWGEDDLGTCEAINLGNVPGTMGGTVFTGCCWGALLSDDTAFRIPAGAVPRPLAINASLALSLLNAGARAFVGCTGTHYSPTVAPYGYFGGPLHEAFWRELLAGKGPAQALFDAKAAYMGAFPHGRSHAVEMAIEMKIFHQYTCLGLGW